MIHRLVPVRQPLRGLLFLPLAVAALSATGCVSAPTSAPVSLGDKPVTAKWTKIVRGVNQMKCEPKPIGDGNDPKVETNEPLTDLSVSCSDDKSVTLEQLRGPLPNPHVCWSDLERLRKANQHVLVVRDPTPGNRYHCLLSVITPKEFVSRAFWRN